SISLSYAEFELLRVLMRTPGQAVSRRTLLAALWGEGEDTPSSRTLDTHMGSLRRKLREGLQQPDPIEAVRGVGYRFVARTPDLDP
ncbi:MAG: helix-turn-helix domain-containing protein, partial [Candidatus Eremiobacterota bacterium]